MECLSPDLSAAIGFVLGMAVCLVGLVLADLLNGRR